MSATAAPYGLVPVEKLGYNPNQGGASRAYVVTADISTPIAVGQLVELNAGVLSAPAAAATKALGVVTGVEYTDPVMKYPVQDSYLPATATTLGYTNIRVFVNDDPNQVYKVQAASGSMGVSKIGTKVDLANNNTASAVTKRCQANATVAAGTTLMIVGHFVTPTSQPTDTFADLLVKIATGVHAYNL